jgi:alcohol dehydrogenase
LRAVVFDGEVNCRTVPDPREEEVVLSVVRAGICGTDLAIAAGKYPVKTPLVLGHEIFGTIKKPPKGDARLAGRRAVTEINVGCGRCEFCRAGVRSHCVRGAALGIHRDGGFADYVATPSENVHLVPDSVSDEEAVFIEPLAACIQITKMAQIRPDSTCAVVGTGRMGLLTIQVLKRTNPRVLVAIGHEGPKLEMARSLGARAFDSSQVDGAIQFNGGAKFDNVVEATGNPGGLEQAMRMVKPQGTLHLKSTHGLSANVDVTRVAVDELRIQGSRCGPFDEAIELLDRKEVNVRELITDRFPLEKCRDAFETAGSRSAVKTLFEVR